MKSKESCRASKERRTTERRGPRISELERTLEKYEGFIIWQAQGYAWRNYGDQDDFRQVGRQAVVQLFMSVEGGIEVRNQQGYYLKSIQNAMLDHYRKEYRRNHEVWEYDRKSGPTRVKRYRYGGEWKARIQYHGDKLRRVAFGRQRTLQFQEYLSKHE